MVGIYHLVSHTSHEVQCGSFPVLRVLGCVNRKLPQLQDGMTGITNGYRHCRSKYALHLRLSVVDCRRKHALYLRLGVVGCRRKYALYLNFGAAGCKCRVEELTGMQFFPFLGSFL